MNASALVLDGHLASALVAVRDLRARGVFVIVGASRRTALALHSNAAAKTFTYPDPKKDLQGYLDCVHRIVMEERIRTGFQVVPYFFSDDTFLPFARASSALRKPFAWSFADIQVIETVFDKQKTLALAKRRGIPIPPEVDLRDENTKYPVIIKPRHTCVWPSEGSAIRGTAKRISSEKEGRDHFKRLQDSMGEEPLIQRCISGEEVGLFTVCHEGRAQGWFAHRRLLGIHPDGGASSIRESWIPPADLESWSSQLLIELGWSGPAMVEWKFDRETDTYRLMEINGRWWGSLPLTVASGYPAIALWQTISTQKLESFQESFSLDRVVRAIHALAVIKCILTCLRWGRFNDAVRAIRLCKPSKKYTIKEDVFSWKDPWPGLWEAIDVVARG